MSAQLRPQIRCLSLKQPWATLVAIGAKRIETRSWRTSYRGPVLIHASKGFPAWARETCADELFAAALNGHRLPLGAAVALAWLDDCRIFSTNTAIEVGEPEASFGDFESGRFGFWLRDVVALPRPIEARGALGLWTPTPELREAALSDLRVAGRELPATYDPLFK